MVRPSKCPRCKQAKFIEKMGGHVCENCLWFIPHTAHPECKHGAIVCHECGPMTPPPAPVPFTIKETLQFLEHNGMGWIWSDASLWVSNWQRKSMKLIDPSKTELVLVQQRMVLDEEMANGFHVQMMYFHFELRFL